MLKRIELTNFKSFAHGAFDVGPLTVLVGANAAGKSNVRDALRFLHGVGLGYTCAEILGGKYGPGGALQWRGIRGGPREVAFGDTKSFALCAFFETEGGLLRYEIAVDVSNEKYGPFVVRESLYRGDELLLDTQRHGPKAGRGVPHGLDLEVSVGRELNGAITQANYFEGFLHPNAPVLSRVVSDPTFAPVPAACTQILDHLRAMRFLDLAPDAMREASPPGQTILGDRGENLSSVLQAICDEPARKAQLLGWLRGLTPMDAVDFDFKFDLHGRVLAYLKESNGQLTSAVSASDGTLRFLALVAALLSPDSGRLYFFEELDNGIHPTRLHLLLDLVQQACAHDRVQVVGTTHNPALLGSLTPEAREHAVLVYRNEHAPDSRLRRIMDLPDAARVLAGHDLGRLHATGWLEDAAVFSEPEAPLFVAEDA